MKQTPMSPQRILNEARNRRKRGGRDLTAQQLIKELGVLQRHVQETVTTATLHLGLQSELQPGAPWNEPRFWSEMVRQMERDRRGFLDEVQTRLARLPSQTSEDQRDQARRLARRIQADLDRFGQTIRQALPRLNRQMEFVGRYGTEPKGPFELALNLIQIVTLFFQRR